MTLAQDRLLALSVPTSPDPASPVLLSTTPPSLPSWERILGFIYSSCLFSPEVGSHFL